MGIFIYKKPDYYCDTLLMTLAYVISQCHKYDYFHMILSVIKITNNLNTKYLYLLINIPL